MTTTPTTMAAVTTLPEESLLLPLLLPREFADDGTAVGTDEYNEYDVTYTTLPPSVDLETISEAWDAGGVV